MMKPREFTRGVTPERAQTILQEHGITVSLDKAAMVLDYMYKMAKLDIDNLKK